MFAENAFSLTSSWLLVAGLRYEKIDLDRIVTDLNVNTVTRFDADYDPLSWRIGTTYDLAPKTQLFAQYSSAVVPVSTIFLMSAANSDFDLSTGESLEAGVKSSLWEERIDVTFSTFRIEQDDILTRDPANSNITYQGGSQLSRGVELSLSSALTKNLRLDASLSAIDAEFDELIEAPKLVHNLIFSMPKGTPPDKLYAAVRKFAMEKFALQHRYAMAMHTDHGAPHVHVVVKAMSEQGIRLNIKKATLREWRRDFAQYLRELGVAANATERAVRGETRSSKTSEIYQAMRHGDSTHYRERVESVARELSQGGLVPEAGKSRILETRREVVRGWLGFASNLEKEGRHDLAADVRQFVDRMPRAQTEKGMAGHRTDETPARGTRSRVATRPLKLKRMSALTATTSDACRASDRRHDRGR